MSALVCARKIVLNSNHPMCDILIRVPPAKIRDLIRVSKRWRQLISSPYFRHNYLTKWQPSWKPSTLICFFIRNTMKLGSLVTATTPLHIPSCPMLSTSSLGCKIKSSRLLRKLGYYIDSSDGFLLIGRYPKAYFLWDPTRREYHQIPRHRVHFEEFCMSLVTESSPVKGFTYKVVRAESAINTKVVKVETYSSETNTWSYSELSCPDGDINVDPLILGRVIRGVIHWISRGVKTRLMIYDTNSEEKVISVVELPITHMRNLSMLGESDNGYLLYGCSSQAQVNVFELVKESNELSWMPSYTVDFLRENRNNTILAPIRFIENITEMKLIGFQTSNSFYFRCGSRIFVWDQMTRCVDEIQYQERGNSGWNFGEVVPYLRECWPSPLIG